MRSLLSWSVLASVLASGACGRIGFAESGTPGDGTAPGDTAPATGPWTHVEAGGSHTCVSSPTETWCWGSDEAGEIALSPPQLTAGPQRLAGTWDKVALSGATSCGIRPDHTLWCWGYGGYGALGDGTTTDHYVPVQVGTRSDWADVSVSGVHACALDQGGVVSCWGDGQYNEQGASTATVRSPMPVSSGTCSAVSAAGFHTCTVCDGTLRCTGENGYAELGTGSYSTAVGFVQIGTTGEWGSVVTGQNHTCGLKLDGSLWCWGWGFRGRLGDGTGQDRTTPTQVGADRDWRRVLVGRDHSCAYRTDGSLWCWGSTSLGELGALDADLVVPTPFGAPISAAVGDAHTCTIDALGALRCAGSNGFGERGAGAALSLVPTLIADAPLAKLATYRFGACGIAMDGTARCWGVDDYGELGDGSLRARQQPVAIAGAGWTTIAPGGHVTVGIAGGKLYAWGQDPQSGTVMATPTMLDGRTDWTEVTAGENHACAIRAGLATCWGVDNYGQLGDGTMGAPRSFGATTVSGNGWSKIAAGDAQTCALGPTGVKCWGYNHGGQVGNGTTTNQAAPAAVACSGACPGTVAKIVAGDDFSCNLFTSGALLCWGQNSYGEFGNGDANPSSLGVAAASGMTFTDVSAGDVHMCGVRADGTLWCWAHGDGGQLGTGGFPSSIPVPTQIGTSNQWKSVHALHHGTCGLQQDGSRWCWGANYTGQYGDGRSWTASFDVIDPRL